MIACVTLPIISVCSFILIQMCFQIEKNWGDFIPIMIICFSFLFISSLTLLLTLKERVEVYEDWLISYTLWGNKDVVFYADISSYIVINRFLQFEICFYKHDKKVKETSVTMFSGCENIDKMLTCLGSIQTMKRVWDVV